MFRLVKQVLIGRRLIHLVVKAIVVPKVILTVCLRDEAALHVIVFAHESVALHLVRYQSLVNCSAVRKSLFKHSGPSDHENIATRMMNPRKLKCIQEASGPLDTSPLCDCSAL